MKKNYIKPVVDIHIMESATLMVGSRVPQNGLFTKDFSGNQIYSKEPFTLGGDADQTVTPASKGHSMWDEDWEDDYDE